MVIYILFIYIYIERPDDDDERWIARGGEDNSELRIKRQKDMNKEERLN